MSLPIAVIIPTVDSRKVFLEDYVLPAAYANDPEIVVVIPDDRSTKSGGRARNAGARMTALPYLFFLDDDTILAKGALSTLYAAVKRYDACVTYCNWLGICVPPGSHPLGPVWHYKSIPWDPYRLNSGNFISTPSIIRRDVFTSAGGWDETLGGYDDWDLWLRMLKAWKDSGHPPEWFGYHVPQELMIAFYLDKGVTDPARNVAACLEVCKKNGIKR
jgi:glycosyltransferase involved in cell wall biosynthesis